MNDAVLIRNERETDLSRLKKSQGKRFGIYIFPAAWSIIWRMSCVAMLIFCRSLDFVVEIGGQVIGNIMYTKAKLIDECGEEKEILTFGPVSILPEYQRKGYGKRMMEYSFERAAALGYDTIVIFGNPGNYVGRGFKSCKSTTFVWRTGRSRPR